MGCDKLNPKQQYYKQLSIKIDVARNFHNVTNQAHIASDSKS